MSEKREMELNFVAVDWWGRAVYRWEDKEIYFSSINTLFPNEKIAPNKTVKEINDYFRKHPEKLYYHGTNMDDDPNGGRSDKWKFNITTNNES